MTKPIPMSALTVDVCMSDSERAFMSTPRGKEIAAKLKRAGQLLAGAAPTEEELKRRMAHAAKHREPAE